MRIVDPVSIRPLDIQNGDVMLCTVKLMVIKDGEGQLRYRIYRCPYDETGDALRTGMLPQGSRIDKEQTVMEQLFPCVGWADGIPDF